MHKVDRLKIKMLIGIDILGNNSVTIDTNNKQATIGSCNNITIPLEVEPQVKNQFS